MWTVRSTATGQTVSVYADEAQARAVAAPMEHHRVEPDNAARWGFSHLPRPRMGKPSPAEQDAQRYRAEQLAALIAHADEGRPLGGGCRCGACPYEEGESRGVAT
jgi:hypothetical protein